MSDIQTAGEMLFNARTTGRRKRELQTIAKQLCIREEYLQALEQGEYNKIPELVYVLGFARNYALELGLDADEIVNKIKQELNIKDEDIDIEPDVIAMKKVPNEKLRRVVKFGQKRWKLFAIIGGIILAIVIAISVFSGSSENTNNDSNVVSVETAEPKYNVSVKEYFGNENRANANVVLQAIGESWVKIEDARGNTVFSRVLVPGDVYFVPNTDGITGTFGKAGALDVWVNREIAPKLGDVNERKEGVELSAENLGKK